jgi:hypothetical protein
VSEVPSRGHKTRIRPRWLNAAYADLIRERCEILLKSDAGGIFVAPSLSSSFFKGGYFANQFLVEF